MKSPLRLLALCAVPAAFLASPDSEPDLTVLFTGDIRGYLSPCGCSKPQIGGLLRMASVIRGLKSAPNTLFVDLGNWTQATGRQDELKADAIAETFASLKPDYLNVGPLDLQLSEGQLASLAEATKGALDSSNAILPGVLANREGRDVAGKAWIQGLVPDGAARATVTPPATVLSPRSDRAHIVLFAGPKDAAFRLARSLGPGSLVIYSSQGDPTRTPDIVGGATLVSLGDKGRYVGKATRTNGKWEIAFLELGPERPDDHEATTAYRSYLNRVGEERLLAAMPRLQKGTLFVGSAVCGGCHVKEYNVWLKTAHAKALTTLEKTGNDKDPECVGCHVVGLTYREGFMDKSKTPDLAHVGCESCHVAGGKHVRNVSERASVHADATSCASCHVPEHSPGFDFQKYWEKIKH